MLGIAQDVVDDKRWEFVARHRLHKRGIEIRYVSNEDCKKGKQVYITAIEIVDTLIISAAAQTADIKDRSAAKVKSSPVQIAVAPQLPNVVHRELSDGRGEMVDL